MTLVVHDTKEKCIPPRSLHTRKIYKKGEVDILAHFPFLTPLSEFMLEWAQSKCNLPLIVCYCVRSKIRVRIGGVCLSRWRGERSGNCIKAISLQPRDPNRRLFLIFYSWSGQPVFTLFATAQKAIPTLNTHTEVHRDAHAHELFSSVVSCPATRRLLQVITEKYRDFRNLHSHPGKRHSGQRIRHTTPPLPL